MKTPLRADRYYQITIASVGLVLLIYSLFVYPPTDTNPVFFLFLAILAGFLVQYSISLLNNEYSLIPLVAVGGSLMLGPVLTAWAITIGICFGYSFRWLVYEKKKWGLYFKLDTWEKIGFSVGTNIIPLMLIFSIFGNSPSQGENLEQAIWQNGLLVSIIFLILHGVIYFCAFAFDKRTAPYPNLRSDIFSIISIDLLSIPFVLIIVSIYPDFRIGALILFSGISILVGYLLYQMNTARIEQERRARELLTLNHISQTIQSTLKLDELLPVIQEQVMQLLDVNNFYVALYDRKTEELWYPFAIKFGQKQNWHRRAISDRLTDRVIQHGQSILLTPQIKPALIPNELPPSEEIPISWLGVPLISSERTIGCMAVFSLRPGKYFTSADTDVLTILSGQASVAIENALLYQQTQHRAHQLETLNKLTAAVTASLELTQVLAQVCNSVAQVGGSQKSAIFLLNPGGETVSLAHMHGLDEGFQQRNTVFSITNSRRARCLQTGKPMIIPDIQNSSISVDLVLHFRADKIQAFADFPLVTPDGQIGFLSVYFTEKHDFPHDEVGFLQTFASQAALAVANARLHARTDAALAQRVNQLTTLEAVGRELSAASHSDQLFNLILKYALEMTNSCCGTVTIYNPIAHNLEVKAVKGYSIQKDEFPNHGGITGRVVRNFSTTNIGDVRADPDYLDLRDGDTRSQLSVPIFHEERMLGIISIESTDLNAYSESEESFVTQLANHAAIDIINAELYHEVQNRFQEQSTLYQVSTKLVSDVSPDQVAQTIIQAIDIVINPLEIGIYIWKQELRIYSLMGEANQHNTTEIGPSPELSRYLLKDTSPRALDSDSPLKSSFPIGCEICQIYIFPFEMSQQRPGFLTLHLEKKRRMNKNEAELIKTIVAQGAISFQNARNFLEAKNGRDRLVAILNSIEEGILMVDIEGHVLLANEPIRELSGFSVEEFLGTLIFELPNQVLEKLGYNQAEIHSVLQTLSRTQISASPKTIYEVKDFQRTRIIERVTTPIWGHDGKTIGLIIVVRDISEEREIEQTRDAITETIVHDVRSPMSAIVGALELLSDSLSDTDNPIIEQSVLVAQRSANRVFSLTDELLDIARLQSGRMEIELQDIDFHSLVEELMIEYTALANDNSVIIRNNVPDQIPIIRADLDKLIRIMTNLVDNAIKFSPQGGHVIISAETETSQFLTIKVTDFGTGIPLDYQEKIFERFIQVPGQQSRRRGTGLGLAFCRLTVQAHGGEIWVDQNPAGGSIFAFNIPLATPK